MTLERWQVGEVKQGIPAKTWNAFCDVAQISLLNRGGTISRRQGWASRHTVLAVNKTGKTIRYGDAVPLWEVPWEFGDELVTPVFEINPYSASSYPSRFGIVVRGGLDDETLEVCTHGMCYARHKGSASPASQIGFIYYDPATYQHVDDPDYDIGAALIPDAGFSTPAGLLIETGVIDGQDWALVDLGTTRGVEIVMLTSTVPAATPVYVGVSPAKLEQVIPATFTAVRIRPDSKLLDIAGRYLGEENVGVKDVQAHNFYLSSVNVTTGKGKLALLVDGVLFNADCNEIDLEQ